MGDVARRGAVVIAPAHIERIQVQGARDLVDDLLDHEHALRAAKAAKRGVRHGVRLAAMRDEFKMLDEIGVVDVTDCAIVDRPGQVRGVAAARGKHQRQRNDAPARIEAHIVIADKIVALAGDQHVGVAIQAQLHRPLCFARQHGRGRGDQRGLAFLAAEAAAHAPALHDDRVRGHAKRVRDDVLHFARMLGRGMNQHRAVFLRQRDRDLTFKIEMILAADRERALQALRGFAEFRARCAAHQQLARNHEAVCGKRAADIEDSGQRLVVDARQLRGLACRDETFRGDSEQRLAGVLHEIRGEDRIVVHDAAVIVFAGHVNRDRDRDHARCGMYRGQVHRLDPPVRDRADAERGVQAIRRQGDIVDIQSAPADVQMRALMADRFADDGAGRRVFGGGMIVHVLATGKKQDRISTVKDAKGAKQEN